jgi:N-acetylmuramoyl-L-alanine amidase CwlA
MLFKTTTQLFWGTYQYKIVLICPGAHLFRNGLDDALDQLKKVDLGKTNVKWRTSHINTQEDLDYAFKLHGVLSKFSNVDTRIESPWISVYSNDKKQIDKLSKINESRVKYVCSPPANVTLASGTIIMPKIDFDYRVTLGKTTQEHQAFIEWAENNKKLKLTKSCKKELSKSRSWGGTHFYITGDNNLLMTKMHLGGSISKVERIIKA